jgi:hypothetical protein
MKKFVLIFVLFGLTFSLLAQSTAEADQVASLKKQILELRNKNGQLEKNLKSLTVQSNQTQESLSRQLKENSQKINALQDSVRARGKLIKNARATACMAIKSLRHRKNLAIGAFVIGLLVFAGVSLFLIRKYKAHLGMLEKKMADIVRTHDQDMERFRSDLSMQINTMKEAMDLKLTEHEKRMNDQERKINELKK